MNLKSIRMGIILITIGLSIILFSHTIQCGRWEGSCKEILDKSASFAYAGIIVFFAGGVVLASSIITDSPKKQ